MTNFLQSIGIDSRWDLDTKIIYLIILVGGIIIGFLGIFSLFGGSWWGLLLIAYSLSWTTLSLRYQKSIGEMDIEINDLNQRIDELVADQTDWYDDSDEDD